jgi:hypothetical protein
MIEPCPVCEAYRQNLESARGVNRAQLDLFATLLDGVLLQEQGIVTLKQAILRALDTMQRVVNQAPVDVELTRRTLALVQRAPNPAADDGREAQDNTPSKGPFPR